MYAIRSYYEFLDVGGFDPRLCHYEDLDTPVRLALVGRLGCRITSYNVCYTKLLRARAFAYPLPRVPAFLDAVPAVLWRKKLCLAHLPRFVPNGRLLDIGCAWGGYLWRMRELGWEVHGIELNAAAARYAQEALGLTNVRSGSRITSYNVCYTKLLRDAWPLSPASPSRKASFRPSKPRGCARFLPCRCLTTSPMIDRPWSRFVPLPAPPIFW